MEGQPRARRRRLAALLAGLLLPLLAGTGVHLWPQGPPLQSEASAAVVQQPSPGPELLRLRSDGRERAVLVQDPPVGTRARALVIVLGPHALTVARSAADLSLDALHRRGWAVAYPSTLDGDWNAGRCCGSPQRDGVDDVGFLQDVRDLLQRRYDLPAGKVGLVGYSTGGQMAYRVACEHPSYARAVVVVAGSLETECAPEGPLPSTLVVHGLDDTTLPWAFSTSRLRLLDHAPRPAVTSAGAYAAAAGCRERVVDRSDGRWLISWTRCAGAPVVTVVGMPDTGHGWDALAGSVYTSRFLPTELDPRGGAARAAAR